MKRLVGEGVDGDLMIWEWEVSQTGYGGYDVDDTVRAKTHHGVRHISCMTSVVRGFVFMRRMNLSVIYNKRDRHSHLH